MKYPLTLITLLAACEPAPTGSNATSLEASIVIMGERISDPSDPEDLPHVEQYPACMAVAVSPDRVLTSDHCEVGSADKRHVLVDYVTWYTTTSGNVLADAVGVAGEVRALKPRKALGSWIGIAAAGPGAASYVVLRGSEIVALPTTLSGDRLTGDVQKGDSGAGVFQGGDTGSGVFRNGKLVGLVQACNSTNDLDCDLPGGRFSLVP